MKHISNSSASQRLKIVPDDEHNQKLVANVHPEDWVNPEPQARYNLVVIGAGTAGLVTAIGAAGLGAKVALVEKHLMGGDCLNVGCVPSKSLIRSSRLAAEFKKSAKFGLNGAGSEVDFAGVMQRVRRIRSGISHHDSAKRFRDAGVDVFLGAARFVAPGQVEVGPKKLKYKKAVIASGARAVEMPIPGLKEAGYLTNETVFNLTQLPNRLAVVGGGPIGCELAQAFQRLGSQVSLFEMGTHVLSREDADAAQILERRLAEEGVRLQFESRIQKIESPGQSKIIHFKGSNGQTRLEVDQILLAVGRQPNIEDLNLEAVDVAYDPRRGVKVDDRLRTSNPRIFAAGDVCMAYKFTHAADAAARIVIQNSLFGGRKKLSGLTVPWCTYTDPEIAHVGLYPRQAAEQGILLDTYTTPMDTVDRAICDGEEEGFVKIHLRKGTDKILGGTIVASHAGEMISEVTAAMVGGMGLGKMAQVIHPYPTQAEAIKKTADAYNRTRLTPLVKKLFGHWLSWTR